MIDTHCHLHDPQYNEDRDQVVRRAFDNGFEALITIGTSREESKAAVELAEKYDNMFATIGLHPHVMNGGPKRAHEWESNLGYLDQENNPIPEDIRTKELERAIEELRELGKREKVVGVGECGLDYFSHTDQPITQEQKSWQKVAYLAQMKLACDLNLPVITHCRDAYPDLFEILNNPRSQILDPKSSQIIIHCYMGTPEHTKNFLTLENVTFSFAGNITYSKNENDPIQESLKMIPLEKIIIETDAPYLSPKSKRGKRNEPSYSLETRDWIANRKNVSTQDVDKITSSRAKKVFSKMF